MRSKQLDHGIIWAAMTAHMQAYMQVEFINQIGPAVLPSPIASCAAATC
jgi:hypothetical protein